MKKLLLGAAAVIAFAAPAVAADLPARPYTKAPAYTAPEAVYNWTGFYIGGHLEGEGSNADILGSGINGSVFANGAGLGGHRGRVVGGPVVDGDDLTRIVEGVTPEWSNGSLAALKKPCP